MPARRSLAALLAATGLALAGCSEEPASSTPAASATTVPSPYVLLDVRTAEEFAQGHLDGAELVSVEAPDFATKIAALDRTATYVIYCRSGNRANIAIEKMRAAGFTDLTNLGSVDQAAAATGRTIIR